MEEFCECRNPTKIIKWKYPFCAGCKKFIKVLRGKKGKQK